MAYDGRRRHNLDGLAWYSSVDHVCRVLVKLFSVLCSGSGDHFPASAVTNRVRRVASHTTRRLSSGYPSSKGANPRTGGLFF